jgi:hypothetical protein
MIATAFVAGLEEGLACAVVSSFIPLAKATARRV